MPDDEDKRFDPTPKRREEYRNQGRIARARDAGAVAGISATLAVIVGTKSAMGPTIDRLFAVTLGDADALVRGEVGALSPALAQAVAVFVVPPMVASVVGGVAIGFAQAGIDINLELIEFKPERLDPTDRIKQMFTLSHGLFEVTLALLKVGAVGWVVYGSVSDALPSLLQLTGATVSAAFVSILGIVTDLVLKALGVMVLIAAADYGQSYFRLEQDMKMSLVELKEEMKQSDGDPHIKGKRRAKQRQLARQRMMEGVRTAAVVVTNPTHVAVALRYDETDPAPIVVAKGHDEIALAIRREAKTHEVPIVENRPLARTLDADVKLGKPIRLEHFAAVAKILALVFKRRSRKRGAPRGRGRSAAAGARGTSRA